MVYDTGTGVDGFELLNAAVVSSSAVCGVVEQMSRDAFKIGVLCNSKCHAASCSR